MFPTYELLLKYQKFVTYQSFYDIVLQKYELLNSKNLNNYAFLIKEKIF